MSTSEQTVGLILELLGQLLVLFGDGVAERQVGDLG